MSIDSVGGGSRDYETRKKSLEEERNRELARIEQRNREDVAKTQAARDKQLREIYENQSSEVEDKRQSSEERVAQAKTAADQRIKSYEDEATRMTEEAKRQFQAKANLLNRNAQEFDEQRKFMLKQQGDTMRRLHDERERAQYENTQRLAVESAKSYLDQKKRLTDVETRGEGELADLRQDIARHKQQATAEGARELNSILAEREQTADSIKRNIDFYKRQGADQMAQARDSLAKAEIEKQGESESRMQDLKHQQQKAVNRTHIQGKRQLHDAQGLYETQIDEARKSGRKHAADIQAKSALTLQAIDEDAKTQEFLARQGYSSKRQELETRREAALAEHVQSSDQLREKLNAEYRAQAKALVTDRAKRLDEQQTQFQSELHAQRDAGRKQVNDASLQNAITLAEHGQKASDPFYRLHSTGAEVSDSGTEFVIHVPVPEHEQDTIRLTQQQGGLTLSGTRRSETRVELDKGRKATTNAYQSYTESVPVSGKLDMGRMSKQYSDGRLTFRIPKI